MPSEPPLDDNPKDPSTKPQEKEARPSEVLTQLQVLGKKVEHLDQNVEEEKKLREKKIAALDRQATWFKRLLVGVAVIALVSFGAAFGSWQTSRTVQKNDKNGRIRDQAGLAGVCGVTDINRITIRNMLTDINTHDVFPKGPGWDSFFKREFDLWTPVECRALVPNDVAVQLCLQYPPTNDPKTGAPTPTTQDPLNKKNCGN